MNGSTPTGLVEVDVVTGATLRELLWPSGSTSWQVVYRDEVIAQVTTYPALGDEHRWETIPASRVARSRAKRAWNLTSRADAVQAAVRAHLA